MNNLLFKVLTKRVAGIYSTLSKRDKNKDEYNFLPAHTISKSFIKADVFYQNVTSFVKI